MANPSDLKLFDELYELKEVALIDSHVAGHRRTLSSLSWGNRKAAWQSDNAKGYETALLQDSGLRLGRLGIAGAPSTSLTLYEPKEVQDRITTSFYIDCGRRTLQVYKRVLPIKATFRGTLKKLGAMEQEWQAGLGSATEEDLELLFSELKRGASGQHTYAQDEVDEY